MVASEPVGMSATQGGGPDATSKTSSVGAPFAAPVPQPPLPVVVVAPVSTAAAPSAVASHMATHPGMTSHPSMMPFHGGGTINITIQHGPGAGSAIATTTTDHGRIDDRISIRRGQGTGMTEPAVPPPVGSHVADAAAPTGSGHSGQPPQQGELDGTSMSQRPEATACATSTRAGACTSCGAHLGTGCSASAGAAPASPIATGSSAAAERPLPVPATTATECSQALSGALAPAAPATAAPRPESSALVLPAAAAIPSLLEVQAAPAIAATAATSSKVTAESAPLLQGTAPRGGGDGSALAGAACSIAGPPQQPSSSSVSTGTTITGRAPRALVVNARSPTQQGLYLAELAAANDEEVGSVVF